MANVAQTREPQRGLTFEDVWAAMMETDRKMQEMTEKSKREWEEIRQLSKETAQQMKETDRKLKETDRIVGDLGNRFGELAEHLVTPTMTEKFRALQYSFTKAGPDLVFFGRDGSFLAEVDVWLENGEYAMAVEVKSKPRQEHVKHHLKRMEVLRAYLDERNDTRKLLGAVAGAIVPPEMRNYILKKGFYLIEQSGDTVKIEPPAGFKPRVW
ncbi:MAG: hypothetical protein LBH35_03085 [Treponema sp.]|jgi:hypothetical protein|nr:hypothetical protein [Treponema sp.]